MTDTQRSGKGPFKASQLRSGDRYELSEGHAYYCGPTGGDGARGTVAGAVALDTDPAVEEAGIDAGYSPNEDDLRAPDIAVGNVPDAPGWISGAPPLAVEYASRGQDEVQLQRKITELLHHGTRWVWVVRLIGPRRVEVYEQGQAMRTVGPGEELVAEGVLQNPVPIEALYDRSAAHEVTLRNLLQRRGYNSLDEVRAEVRVEGRAESVLMLLGERGLQVPDAVRARIRSCTDMGQLDAWFRKALSIDRAEALFEA